LDDLQVLDSEGRALITDHELFVLVNLYGESLDLTVLTASTRDSK
jgi:hypothetical protein